jgi:hypothetical protein
LRGTPPPPIISSFRLASLIFFWFIWNQPCTREMSSSISKYLDFCSVCIWLLEWWLI